MKDPVDFLSENPIITVGLWILLSICGAVGAILAM